MSREVRRVPLDFEWPTNKVWDGYVMPDDLRLPRCTACGGAGWNGSGAWLATLCWRLCMLADDVDREQPLGRRMHPWLTDDPYPPTGASRSQIPRPDSDIVELLDALGVEAGFLGRTNTDGYRLARRLVEVAGLDSDTWGLCRVCSGRGHVATREQEAEHDAWQPTDPPVGEGWQLWETVSEGSPLSPVFPDDAGLIGWLTTDAYRWSMNGPLTRAQAENLVRTGGTLGTLIYTPATGLIASEQFVPGGSS